MAFNPWENDVTPLSRMRSHEITEAWTARTDPHLPRHIPREHVGETLEIGRRARDGRLSPVDYQTLVERGHYTLHDRATARIQMMEVILFEYLSTSSEFGRLLGGLESRRGLGGITIGLGDSSCMVPNLPKFVHDSQGIEKVTYMAGSYVLE